MNDEALTALKAENDALWDENEALKNPSDGRCMEIVALREHVKTLTKERDTLKKRLDFAHKAEDAKADRANELQAQLKLAVEAIKKIIDHAECMQIRYKAEEDRLKAALDIRDARKALAKLGQKEGGA